MKIVCATKKKKKKSCGTITKIPLNQMPILFNVPLFQTTEPSTSLNFVIFRTFVILLVHLFCSVPLFYCFLSFCFMTLTEIKTTIKTRQTVKPCKKKTPYICTLTNIKKLLIYGTAPKTTEIKCQLLSLISLQVFLIKTITSRKLKVLNN